MCTWVLLGSSKALTVATTILQMCTWVLRDSSKALTCTGTLHEECTGACKRDLEHRSAKCITTVTCRCCRIWKTLLQNTGPGKHICTIHHNRFGMPLIEYMDSCTSEPAPVWTKNLALNHTALLAEMAGITMGADEPLHMDKWIEFIKDTLCRLLKVDVPSRLILQVMSPMVSFYVAPTPANALHLLRSGWCSKVVGPALAAQTNRLLLAEIADVPVQLQSAEALNLSVTQDLIATLENLHCGPHVHETQDNTPAKQKGEETLRVSWRACMRRLHRSCSC